MKNKDKVETFLKFCYKKALYCLQIHFLGMIYLNATTPETLRDAIIDVVLTQIDPSVIDAQTATDFGLINEETNKPFFWGQVLDHKGKPISKRRAALEFANFLLRKKIIFGENKKMKKKQFM